MALLDDSTAIVTGAAQGLGEAELEVHVSVDPTQIGYAISDELGEANTLQIGRTLADLREE